MIDTQSYYQINGDGRDEEHVPPFCYSYPMEDEARAALRVWLLQNAARLIVAKAKWEFATHLGLTTGPGERWRELVQVRLAGPVEECTMYGETAVSALVACRAFRRVSRQEEGPHGVAVTVESVEEIVPRTSEWPRQRYSSQGGKPIEIAVWRGIHRRDLYLPPPEGTPRVWRAGWYTKADTPAPPCTPTLVAWRRDKAGGGSSVDAYCIGDTPAELDAAMPPAVGDDGWHSEVREAAWQAWQLVQKYRGGRCE